MSISEFFTLDLVPSGEVFFRDHELLDIAVGPKITMKLLGRQTKGRAMQILHEYYEPGADTGESMLRHDGEEGGGGCSRDHTTHRRRQGRNIISR